MSENRYSIVLRRLLWVSLIGLAACSTSDQSTSKPATASSSLTGSRPGAQKSPSVTSDNLGRGQERSSLDSLRRGEPPTTPAGSALQEVYFAFDSYNLSNEARSTLKSAADWLKKNTAARAEIEGHCDERGTSEYNLALGAKRAQAAKDYLITLGIAANRLSTTSYGEEIPVCREQNETCWQRNRRDRFITRSSQGGTF